MPSRRYAFCSLALIACLVVGCSGSKSPVPTAPNPTAAASTAPIDLTTDTPMNTPGAGFDKPVVGLVTQVAGACPDLTFVVSGVTVHASTKTTFEGGTCADLKDGVRAGAMGTKNADGSIAALRVKMAPAMPDVPKPDTPKPDVPKPEAPKPVVGAVSGLVGTCPAVTFTLSGTTIHTTDKTVFDGAACSDLKEGMRAGAIGPKGPDGSLTAERLKAMPASPNPGAMKPVIGVVESLTGTCPALTFVVDHTTVRTRDKTHFGGGDCGHVTAGIRVGVTGPKAADGAVEAVVVKVLR